jgi:hypothetical protein
MKLTVEIWDKQSPINGYDASKYLASNPDMANGTILFVKEGERVVRIESADTMRSVYGWEDKTDEEVITLLTEQVNADAPPELSPLDNAKANKLAEIDAYDNSEAVNSFLLAGMPCWIPVQERSTYNASIASAETLGETTIDIPIAGRVITLPVVQAKYMLARIQRYADKAAIVTATHKAAVAALETIEAVEAYDFTAGYPEKESINPQQ